MKTLMIVTLSLFSFSAFAAGSVQMELGGACQIMQNTHSDIAHNVAVGFDFPNVVQIEKSKDDFYSFGAGTAIIDQDIEMMDANRNIIVKPIQAAITVTVSPDQKTKKLSATVRMYNIFTGKIDELVLLNGRSFNQSIDERFAYFQLEAKGQASTSQDKISGASIFCHFN